MGILKDLSDAFQKGRWGMWPILATSIVVLAIVIERAVYLVKASIDKDKLIALLKSQVMSGNVQGAIKVCSGNPTPMTRIIQAGLTKFNKSDAEVQAAMDEAALRELPLLNRILRAAVRYDLPVNMLCWGNVDAGRALIDRHPDTRFIIDHLALVQPRTPPAPPQPWADLPKVLELAKRPNAVIKVSGACTLSREPYPFPDIWDPLARVFDAWGFERCLWGTDWTRAFAVVNYEQAVEPFLKTDRLSASERAMLMGGACAEAYRWSPKKG